MTRQRFSAALAFFFALSMGFALPGSWVRTVLADHPPGIQHAPFIIEEDDNDRHPEEGPAYDDNGPPTIAAVGTLEQMEAFNRDHPQQSQGAVPNIMIGGHSADGTGAEQPSGVTQAPGDSEPLAPPLSASF